MWVPFAGYADFECMLEPIENQQEEDLQQSSAQSTAKKLI